MGMVPKTTKSEIKLYKGLGIVKFFGFIGTFMGSFYLGDLIFTGVMLKILFSLFCIIVFIICNLKSPTDPSKSFVKGLKDYLKFLFHKKDIFSKQSREYITYKGECDRHASEKAAKRNSYKKG